MKSLILAAFALTLILGMVSAHQCDPNAVHVCIDDFSNMVSNY